MWFYALTIESLTGLLEMPVSSWASMGSSGRPKRYGSSNYNSEVTIVYDQMWGNRAFIPSYWMSYVPQGGLCQEPWDSLHMQWKFKGGLFNIC